MFGEKKTEYAKGIGELPVWQSPKYTAAKDKAIEIIKDGRYELSEADFWILMNLTAKKDKMAYTGLIISHNGCLKINDKLESRFDPECVTCDKEGYKGSLVYSYCNKEQGIYEVGEVSASNCKNEYPYAMAYKRLFDRVVLKLSRLAYSGIYSDSESDEFSQQLSAKDSDLKPNVYGEDAAKNAEWDELRMKIFSMADPDKCNAAAKRKYGRNIGELSADELREILAKMEEKHGAVG